MRNTVAGPINPNKKTKRKTIQKSTDIADRNDQRPRAGVVGIVDGVNVDFGIPLKDHMVPFFNPSQLHSPK